MLKNKKYIYHLILLVALWPLAIDIYLPAFPDIGIALSASAKELKSTVTFFAIGFGIGQLVLSRFIDQFGRRQIALLGISLYLLCSVVQIYAPTIEALVFFRVVQGLSAAATATIVTAIAKDVYDQHSLPKVLSFLNGVLCCVPALAPVLGAFLTESYGYRATFVFMAGYALFAFIFIFLKLPETFSKNNAIHRDSSFGAVLLERNFLFYSLISMLSMAVIISFVSNSPVWLLDRLSLSIREFSFWFGINAVISIIGGMLIAPYLIGKFGVEKTLKIGLIFTISSGFIMLNENNTAISFMIPIFINSAGTSLTLGTSSSLAISTFSNNIGRVSALLGFIQIGGAGLFVLIIQIFELSSPSQLALHMIMLLPALLVLTLSKKILLKMNAS
ncbi:multidrug effflux MFS transporter [Bowmanella pacifica]|nr:multidrug effflux MFS transporter [Bowmanella pacifica]